MESNEEKKTMEKEQAKNENGEDHQIDVKFYLKEKWKCLVTLFGLFNFLTLVRSDTKRPMMIG